MDWFYQKGNEPQGPVGGIELLSLVHEGLISDSNLVWSEGMEHWTPVFSVFEKILEGERTDAPELDLTICSYSRTIQKRSDLLNYGDVWILPRYKEAFVQRLAEGDLNPTDSREYHTSLGFGSIFAESWKIFTKYFAVIASIHFTVWFLPDQLVAYGDQYFFITGIESIDIRSSIQFSNLMEALFGIISIAAIIRICMHHEAGIEVTYKSGIRDGVSFWWKVFLSRFCWFICILAILLVGMVPVIIAISKGYMVAAGIWGTVWAILGIVFAVRTSFITNSVLDTSRSGFQPIRTSFRVSKGHFWRIVGYLIPVGIIVFIPYFILGLVYEIPALAHWSVVGLLTTVSGLMMYGFGVVFLQVLYRRLSRNCNGQ